ncbi:MAG: DUF1003 domain-containing protein [Cytophagales bacterium]|nr:DUF1003 domain-containing protein [Cytophagales bacterium]
MKTQQAFATCQLTGKKYPLSKLTSVASVHPHLKAFIQEKHPEWTPEGYITTKALNYYRSLYIRSLDHNQPAETTPPPVSSEEEWASLTLGQRLADKIADFGGSWTFIILFFSVLVSWMLVNAWLLGSRAFDPFPFILLNLVLSCLAAVQAPIIMMSQNRQEDKDRLRAYYDYQVNLKAEREIRELHEKIDRLLQAHNDTESHAPDN